MEDYTGATYVQSPQRQGYESNDPFTSSISQRVQNSRVVPQNMDDVPLPPDGYEGYYTGDDPYVVGINDRPTVGATDPHHFRSGRRYSSSNSTHSRSPRRYSRSHHHRHSRSHRRRDSRSPHRSYSRSPPRHYFRSHSRSRSPRPQYSYGRPTDIPPVFPPYVDLGFQPHVPYPRFGHPFISNPIISPYGPTNDPGIIYTIPPFPPQATFRPNSRIRPGQLNSDLGSLKSTPLWTYMSTLVSTLPHQVYLLCLLRLPAFYFSRVDRIFKDADLSLSQMKEMALKVTAEHKGRFRSNLLNTGTYYRTPDAPSLPPAYKALKANWESFIDGLIKEWETLNIVSVLLLASIMTVFQIQGAGNDPITRYLAFWSLICALVSLLYGCVFIIRFGTIRKTYKAAEWALEAKNSQTVVWNGGVMLAMPGIWLAWSILTFTGCMISFMWRAPANLPSDFVFTAPPSLELGFRIFICVVLGVGTCYGVLILDTFRRYGTKMDEAWKNRVDRFLSEDQPPYYDYDLPPPGPHPHYPSRPYESVYASRSPPHVHFRHRSLTPPPHDNRREQDAPYGPSPPLGTPKSAVHGLSHDLSGNRSPTLAPVDTPVEGRRRKRSISCNRQPPSSYVDIPRIPPGTQQTSPYTPSPLPELPAAPQLSRRTQPEIPRTRGSRKTTSEPRPTSPATEIPSLRNTEEVGHRKDDKSKRKERGKG